MDNNTGEIIAGAHELPGRREFKPPGELPRCVDALAEFRKNATGRVLSPGEAISLDKRQDLLFAIFNKNNIRLGPKERIVVYNPAVITTEDGEIEFLGRAEGRETKFSTLMVHFRLIDGEWTPQDDLALKLEDPATAIVHDQIVVAGVKINHNIRAASIDYKTTFYKGPSLDQLKPFENNGPPGMKDIRIVELANGKIGMYTRPQGLKGGLGQIGFTIVDSLDDLNEQVIQDAPLITSSFPEGEWGGANQAKLLPDGRVLVLGHRAYRDKKGARHYFPWAFVHNTETGKIQDLGILAESANFPPGEAKAWDLKDVLFSAGFILEDEKLTLYVGMRDTGVGKIVIDTFKIPPDS